ncbi:MAG: 30S ribosomal protein S6 [Planctomycetes bacterium]|nr:30S ribosomal protein S6 [Planctomycetota bacterium]
MRPYEGMFLLDSSVPESEVGATVRLVHGLIEKLGGQIVTSRKWGDRRLAYEIGKHKKAHYELVYFRLPPENVATLRHDLELSEPVLRQLVLVHDEQRFEKLLAAEKDAAARAEQEAKAALEAPRARPAEEAPAAAVAVEAPPLVNLSEEKVGVEGEE